MDEQSLGERVEQENNRQRTMEDIDGRLHPAVDGQSLGEMVKKKEGEDLCKVSQS